MDIQKTHLLATIIIKIKLGKVTDEERAYMLEWLDEDHENRELFKDIIHGVTLRERIIVEDSINETTDFEEVKQIIIQKLTARKIHGRRLSYRVAAAVAAVLILCSVPFFVDNDAPVADILAAEEHAGEVQLILHTGQKIDIGTDVRSIEELVSTAVDTAQMMTGQSEAVPMNRLITFREGQSSFRLEDGTTVWLNVMSELDFPAYFGNGERVVHLRGEAYFEVAHDPRRPFIVVTRDQSVRALGTSFNVQAYLDEYKVYTTLVTGSVKVTRTGDTDKGVILTLGMQSILNRSSGEVSTVKVNASDMAAWRYGEFIFNEEPIDNVTRMLSRWHDVEFIYPAGYHGSHTFTGKINRTQSLKLVLENITMAGGPNFESVESRVYVTER